MSPASLPRLGLGTWQIKGDNAYRAVRHALEVGYRHIDTAQLYGNEDQVGRALRDSGIDREEVFVTTKYPQRTPGGETEALTASLRALGLERVDLWLMHFPLKSPEDNARVWDRFSVASTGRADAIGVSNHSIEQLDALVAATGRAPAVNQIRFNPALYDPTLVAAHRERGILLEGHSPLRRPTLTHPILTGIADRHRASSAQVLLAWHFAHDIPAIPKSVHVERITENFGALDVRLSESEVSAIDALGKM
ncbi:aldo/keto reductase [Nocardia terpenica]|uniref:NADP-dependent oxidoreductase domain-containing protein n=1 Tax=Nocardia terpenica TaxID=455432 RepID=A0A161WNS7_9NOCA|nr:aldo/keto reductase [Nocardia terpenica]KZM74745.1 hypothetical protein AWN90_22100 [Nocardia terpenica]NQE93634.1 aldo/keto reductase [Nocardia terpenica]